jgi:hypothetical protein
VNQQQISMDDLDIGQTVRDFSPGQKLFNRYTLKTVIGRGLASKRVK